MSGIKGARPSPALIVAVLALVAALAGTAIAGPGASTSALTKAKVRKIAKKQANKLLPIDSGELADGAVTGPKIANGSVSEEKLATGALTPRVFMHFDSAGNFQPGESRGVVGVDRPAPNVACLDLDITARIGGANRGIAAGSAPFNIQIGLPPEPEVLGCPAGFRDAVVQVAAASTLPDVYAWFD
jgi:hypothetical protein